MLGNWWKNGENGMNCDFKRMLLKFWVMIVVVIILVNFSIDNLLFVVGNVVLYGLGNILKGVYSWNFVLVVIDFIIKMCYMDRSCEVNVKMKFILNVLMGGFWLLVFCCSREICYKFLVIFKILNLF